MSVPSHLLGRRAALTALACALGVGLCLAGIPLYASYATQRSEIEDSLRQLATFRAEAALQPALEQQLRSLKLRGAAAPGFVVAGNAALAQAEVEHAIKDIASANGTDVRSMQIGPVEHRGTLDAVSVQCDLSVPITRLKRLLFAVETHTPYLYIDQIDIAAPVGWQQSGGSQVEPRLEIHWTVHAFRWGAL